MKQKTAHCKPSEVCQAKQSCPANRLAALGAPPVGAHALAASWAAPEDPAAKQSKKVDPSPLKCCSGHAPVQQPVPPPQHDPEQTSVTPCGQQVLATHDLPAPQAVPQWPQLAASVAVSTQEPLQSTSPLEHPQFPPEQVVPGEQA